MYRLIVSFLHFIGVNRKPTPVRLGKQVSWREKHEEDLIITGGILLIIFLFFFAFFVVGQMDPYYNGGLV